MKRRAAVLGIACLVALAVASRASADVTGVTGGGQPFSNMQPSLGVNYLVRTDGVFNELGDVRMFAGNYAPASFALAHGQLQAISLNQALFAHLGTTYGGDGRVTFALPDLRGRTPLHAGTGTGGTTWMLGETTGTETATLTSANLPPHVHTLSPTPLTTGATGGGQPFSTMQPSLALNYSIVESGVYAGPASSSGGLPFIGQVRLTARNSVPNSEAATNGQVMIINQNTALFSIVGTTYGGNGLSTFAVPDLRGRAAMGAGAAPGLTSRGLGETDGAEAVAMTQAQMPQHTHTLPPTPLLTGPAGGSQPLANLQPSLALNYLIATEGIFPARESSANQETFLGEIVLFAGNYAPTDFHIADGSLLPIATNQELFAILGTTYGGDGRTTFALPDLRGRAALEPGIGPGLTERMPGEMLGSETVTLTTAELAPHSHDVVPEPSAGAMVLLGAALVTMRRRRAA